MDADVILREFLGLTRESNLESFSEASIISFILKFAIWPSVNSYQRAPWLARYAIRRQRYRHDPRAPGEKRDLWGMPNEQGYFADDNSLIKSAYKNLPIRGLDSPYGNLKIKRGLVCCHIWPNTTSDALLFSFLPNLVWLPRSLAKYTDVLGVQKSHKAHFILQNISVERYKEVSVQTGQEDVKTAWSRLHLTSIERVEALELTELESEPYFSRLVSGRHEKLIDFLGAAISSPPFMQRRFSKRYHLGFGSGLDLTVSAINEIVSKENLVKLQKVLVASYPDTSQLDVVNN